MAFTRTHDTKITFKRQVTRSSREMMAPKAALRLKAAYIQTLLLEPQQLVLPVNHRPVRRNSNPLLMHAHNS